MKIAKSIEKYSKKISKSLFLKFFLAYTIISVLMVILIGVYTRFYILKNLDAEIERFEQKKINETLNTMDIMFGEMKKLSLNHALNTKCLQFAYMPRSMAVEKQSEVKSVQELLANSINSSNYIDSISIYYEKSGYLLDYSGLASLSSYYDRDWHKDYIQMIGSTTVLDTRKVKNRASAEGYVYDNIITFLTRIPYGGTSREGAVILNVEESIVSDLLKNITQGDKRALAFVVNDKGTIISSSRSDDIYRNIAELLQIPAEYPDQAAGRFNITYLDTKMVAYYDQSDINNWELFYVVPQSILFEKSVNIRNITFIILMGLLLFMTAAALLFSFKIYNPVKSLINSIRKISSPDDEGLSDVSMIQGELIKLLQNNKSLEEQLNGNKIIMRGTFLSQLITGRLFNREEIMNRADYLSVQLNFECYKAAVLQVNPSAADETDVHELELKKIALVSMVEKVFGNLKIAIDCTRDMDDNILVLMKLEASADTNEAEALIEHALEDIQKSIREFLDLTVSIGTGRAQKNISGIGVSYRESVEALRYKFLNGDAPVVSFREIAGSQADMLHYPLEMEQKLITLINLCDYDKTVLVLGEMLENILDCNKSFKNIEVCLTNMTGIIQRCIYELHVNIKDIFGEDAQLSPPIGRFKNVQQFKEWISEKFRVIIEYRTDRQRRDTRSFIQDVKEYLDKKYAEEISLLSVASHFNYSSSYFCKTFKDRTGISFWDYVSKIRIEKSKALLSGTNRSIGQIAGLVGYNNRFSYIRTFKKYVALTPGEYRARYSAK